ncbi:MAG: AAA family ATPase [Flavitalea sp.]
MIFKEEQRIVLITGTSHVGKTTCAVTLSEKTGFKVISTDTLARHPGRPSDSVPSFIIEYYNNLSDDTIHWFLKVHHENMRAVIQETIQRYIKTDQPLVLEGAALRPEYFADWNIDPANAYCLYAEPAILIGRIKASTDYNKGAQPLRIAIDKFIERSLRENELLAESAEKNGVAVVVVNDFEKISHLATNLANNNYTR